MSGKAQLKISVIGAGSWGTALALQFARRGHDVSLWGRDQRQLAAMARDRENRRYLPDARFPDSLHPIESLQQAVKNAAILLIAVPSHGLRETLLEVRPFLRQSVRVCWATKGFELATGKLPHQVVEEILGNERPLAVLSGPTFAREVGDGLPTAMTVAANDNDFAAELAAALSDESFRAYTSSDMTGVEVGGAVKNVLAIASGMAYGRGFGDNTLAAVITRGLAEMMRLGVALGGKPLTFSGLAGVGDLVATCTSPKSRNRTVGEKLGQGMKLDDIIDQMNMVAEGVKSSKAILGLANRAGVEMPITEGVVKVVHDGLDPADMVKSLMSREAKPEIYGI